MDAVLSQLRAAAEHTRLRLLHILSHNELTVTEITAVLDQSQPRVSRHLKILCEAGLLDRIQEGASVFYRLAHDATVSRALLVLLPEHDRQLRRDRERLDDVKRQHALKAMQYFKEHAEEWERIRELYLADPAVEQAMLVAAGSDDIGDFLDIGTGTGRILTLFGHRVRRGLGIDSSREMLAIARAHLEAEDLAHCQVRKGDIHDLPLAAACMDVVTIHHVLHFLDDPALAIAQAARVLRPTGRLIIVDFARHHLELLRTEFAHRRLGFTDEEISAWCRAAGLVDIEVSALPSAAGAGATRPETRLWVGDRPSRAKPSAADSTAT